MVVVVNCSTNKLVNNTTATECSEDKDKVTTMISHLSSSSHHHGNETNVINKPSRQDLNWARKDGTFFLKKPDHRLLFYVVLKWFRSADVRRQLKKKWVLCYPLPPPPLPAHPDNKTTPHPPGAHQLLSRKTKPPRAAVLDGLVDWIST